MASLGPRFLTSGASCTKSVIKSPLLTSALPSCTQVANLRSVNNPFPLPPRQKPFTHKFTPFWQLFDTPIKRMNENAIVVIVEGNLGTGKKAMAKKIAKEFDLLYVEDIDYNSIYVDQIGFRGFNYQEINACSPNRTMFNNLDTFWATEKLADNPMIMRTQFDAFHKRWRKYRDALKHLCNTGQGIVMARNLYSDMVFCYAMMRKKLFKKSVYREYEEYIAHALKHLWTPHFMIYLEATPAYSLKKIKERNVPFEMNSPLLQDEEFLSYMIEGYEKVMLPNFEPVSEIMCIEADNPPDDDLFVEELEKIDFNPFRDTLLRDDKFSDWRLTHERQWATFRLWADHPFGHVGVCPEPDSLIEIRDIQLTLDEVTTINDFLVRKDQYYYDKEAVAGKDGMGGALKRLFLG